MLDNGFRFESDQFICHINSPIQILHAEDDNVVPYKLGRKVSLAFFEMILRDWKFLKFLF